MFNNIKTKVFEISSITNDEKEIQFWNEVNTHLNKFEGKKCEWWVSMEGEHTSSGTLTHYKHNIDFKKSNVYQKEYLDGKQYWNVQHTYTQNERLEVFYEQDGWFEDEEVSEDYNNSSLNGRVWENMIFDNVISFESFYCEELNEMVIIIDNVDNNPSLFLTFIKCGLLNNDIINFFNNCTNPSCIDLPDNITLSLNKHPDPDKFYEMNKYLLNNIEDFVG